MGTSTQWSHTPRSLAKKLGIYGAGLGFREHFEGDNNIRNIFIAPKNMDNITQKSGVIYMFKCDLMVSKMEYIGKLAGNFGKGSRNI